MASKNVAHTARVATRSVGQAFGVTAVVKRGGTTLHVTDARPFGFESAAVLAALRWCAANGVTVHRDDYEAVSWIASVDGLRVAGGVR